MPDDSEQRQFFFDVWEKSQKNQKLNGIEKQVQKIIEMHPEVHSVLSHPEIFSTHEFDQNEPDPFAHLGLHSIVIEMIGDDSPQGIRSIYDQWIAHTDNKHHVQHQLMSTVFDWLIESARNDIDSTERIELLNKIENQFLSDISND